MKEIKAAALTFLRGSAAALAVGLVVGLIGAGFAYALHGAAEAFAALPWLLFLLPAAGPAIVFCYRRLGKIEKDRGTNGVLDAARGEGSVPVRTAPLIAISTVLTHLFGGSAGREGAAIQLGGSIASGLGKLLRLDDADRRVLVMAGMAAGFSALFGTPLTATVFALEVVNVGVMHYSALVPCLVAALTARRVTAFLGLSATHFTLSDIPAFGVTSLLQSAALGILCALLAILVCRMLHTSGHLFTKYIPNPYLRALLGGALVVALTLLLGRSYNGAGESTLHAATAGMAVPIAAFILKPLFTALTLGSGYKGGEIVPVLFTGATFGATVAPWMGMSASFGAGLCMAALFCGVTNCPLSAILLACELFGADGLPLMALAVGIAFLLSGSDGLYNAQRLMFSKLRPENL